MGYDDPKSLGGREFGATLAMPIWIDYMRVALQKAPPRERPVPEGVVQAEDGSWMYAEYANDASVRTIDLDAQPPAPTQEPGATNVQPTPVQP
jgi:penicillin-binding protein 1A